MGRTPASRGLQPDGVLETCLYVDDLPAAETFYRDVLGLTLHSRHPGRHVFLHCGASMVLLFDADASSQGPAEIPLHGAHGPGHMALAVEPSSLPAWRQRLLDAGVAVEHEHHWSSGGVSLYFRDPAGNSLELATPQLWMPLTDS